MTSTSFYRSIYPTDLGVRVLAVLDKGAPPRHYFFETDEDLIAAAAAHDRPGRDVYHACAVYSEPTNRKGENAKAAKSLWVDLDVGPTKSYGTAKAAAEHLEAFRVEAGLQPPHLVKSGSGIHAYFPFDKAINPDQWRRLAGAMAACMDHYGVGYDPSRATDIASILRIPGAHNYKTDPPKPVKLLRLGESEPAGTIWKRLKDYAELNDLLLDAVPAKTIVRQPVERNELMGNVNHAPAYGEIIAQHCAVIDEVAETGGDVGYEIWWRALGIAKFTVEPEETAAHWTRNREQTGHDQSDWQTVMASWPVGPTTCAEFSKHSDKCRVCPHFEKAMA